MTRAMRLYCIDKLIQEKGSATLDEILQATKSSQPTVKRDLRYMRENLGAPIVYSRAQESYFYSQNSNRLSASRFKQPVPPMWYTPEEMYVVVSVLQMLDGLNAGPQGLLTDDLLPLKSRICSLIRSDMISVRDLQKNVKVVTPAYRRIKLPTFQVLGCALGEQRRVRITYFTQGRQEENAREISPLRLVNYRHRWYVEAWCHQTEALKTFSVENIRSAELLTKQCKKISMKTIRDVFDSTYGIFSGKRDDRKTAVIEIDAVMTPYVKNEIWHNDQTVEEHDDGSMTLTVPFARETELASRVIALGSHAFVKTPVELKDYIKQELAATLARYGESEKQ